MKVWKRRKAPTIAIVYHYVSAENAATDTKAAAEHDLVDNDTEFTVRTVRRALYSIGFQTQVIKLTGKDLTPLKKIKADYIFNLTDSHEMELRIAEVLDRLHIPYSGSPYYAILNSNNKVRSKGLFEKMGIPTAKFTAINLNTKITRSLLPSKFPLIVKPAYEHCSVGITDKSVVTTYRQFKNIVRSLKAKVHQTLLAEQFIKGKEVDIVVLESANQTIALPPVQMKFRGHARTRWNIYGFSEKWDENSSHYNSLYFEASPDHIPAHIISSMQRDSIRAFYALGFRDYARFDLRYSPKTKQYYFLEGNANPGLSTNHDDALMAALLAVDLTFEGFIREIIANRLEFHLPKRAPKKVKKKKTRKVKKSKSRKTKARTRKK